MNPAGLRQEYIKAHLDEKSAARDPYEQFDVWFNEAVKAQLPQVNAMTLATASRAGVPNARIVLLKGVDPAGFVFFTNYLSQKGHELADNPTAALLLHWTELEREVRILGEVSKVTAAESDEYFRSRPLGSRHAAIASPQSEPVSDRTVLEARFLQAEQQYPLDPPRPAQWGGYRLTPTSMEFWQGRANRLHDRLLYRRHEGTWRISRLAP